LKGELLLTQREDNSVAAEQCFQEAVNIARRRNAKTFELTATTELARLLAQLGHRDQAYMMLSKIYNWFTEGFETRALKRAKAVLEELRN
jgi:predicted ATPase